MRLPDRTAPAPPAATPAGRPARSRERGRPRGLARLVVALLAAPLAFAAAVPAAADPAIEADGVLDRPLVPTSVPPPAGVPAPLAGGGTVPAVSPQALREEVRIEQEALEVLPRAELEQRAEDGERAAQVVLGVDFAKEAETLAFAPAAANDALADAARWYSAAAARGFPGAPSLDQAGVKFWPIRFQRETRP